MIGVIGAYGSVGLQVARMLKRLGVRQLRLGGRNPYEAELRLDAEFPEADWMQVDVEDDGSSAEFLDDCRLVVNCAGPSYRTSSRIARLCLDKRCHLVDAGMDDGLETFCRTQTTAVVYAAGATPGLSGVLPRWLAQSFDSVDYLRHYTGALDVFTTAAAEDYLVGVMNENNRPLAAWKHGALATGALKRRFGVELPLFSRAVTLYPYFDKEAGLMAALLSLADGEWYIGVDGNSVTAVLEDARRNFAVEREATVQDLCRAAALDSAGRRRYMNFVVQLDGGYKQNKVSRTLLVQAERPAALTGSVAAVAAIAVLAGEIPAGVCTLAEVPRPAYVVEHLQKLQAFRRFEVVACSIDELMSPVEGVV